MYHVETTLEKTVKKIGEWMNCEETAENGAWMELLFKSFDVYGKEETRQEIIRQGLMK